MDDEIKNELSKSEDLPEHKPAITYGYSYRRPGATKDDLPPGPPHMASAAIPPPGYYDHDGSIKMDRRKTDKRFNRFVIMMLILCTIGAPFAGLGIGLGTRIFDRYLLPNILNDSATRENFAFSNVHTPLETSQSAGFADFPALVEMVEPSVVLITATSGSGRTFGFGAVPSAGSGIIMYETQTRYYIATNAHVIENAREVWVSIAGSLHIPAVPVGRDDDADLAVIAVYKYEAIERGVLSAEVARFGNSENVRVGEFALAIGNSMGEGNSVTYGIISAINREIRIGSRHLMVLQTDAAINRGNSGGPLINTNGEVIGINTAKFSEQLAQGMGYAIPSHVAMPILERLVHEYGQADGGRPMIGVSVSTMNDVLAAHMEEVLVEQGFDANSIHVIDRGVLVNEVFRNTPADSAGLKVNDIITSVNGIRVLSSNNMIDMLSQMAVGDEVLFDVQRNGSEYLEIIIILGPFIPSF